MPIIAHAGHGHGIDPFLITIVIVALVLGSMAALAAVRGWQQRSDSDADGHDWAGPFTDDTR